MKTFKTILFITSPFCLMCLCIFILVAQCEKGNKKWLEARESDKKELNKLANIVCYCKGYKRINYQSSSRGIVTCKDGTKEEIKLGDFISGECEE